MTTLYWLSLVVGGGLVLLAEFGDLLHLDLPDFNTDAGAWHILSLRTGIYGLFAFGVTGLLLGWVGEGALTAFAGASVAGLASGAISGFVFRYLRGHQSGEVPADDSLIGLAGRVILPLQRGGTGKILVSRSGREIELLAGAFDVAPDEPVETWTSVVVVEVSAGVALVTPYASPPELPPGEG